MINKKNISFFILFLMYVIIFFASYRYIGKDVVYASIPMVLGASIIYNYIVGFAAVVLNIPATLLLMYIAGVPFTAAVKNIEPFVILLQCICVVVPGLVRIYNEKNSVSRSKETVRKMGYLQDRIDEEKEEIERLTAENGELKLISGRYKALLDEARTRDQLSGLFSRDGIIAKAQRSIVLHEPKAYIFLRMTDLDETNRTYGIFKGDDLIRKTGKKLLEISAQAGRISGGCFLLIEDPASADALIEKIKTGSGGRIDIVKIIPEADEGIEEIFRRRSEK
jgi:GGDEF domain-containing protein